MKLKFLFAALAVSLLISAGFAQTIKVNPKKTVYTRKGKNIEKERRTFTVVYPVVSGAPSAVVKKKIDDAISYWRVFETTLQENLTDSTWLTEAAYKVNYNNNNILDIALTFDTMGAYPDSNTKTLIINEKTGNIVKFDDVFKPNTKTAFAALVNKKLQAETAQRIKEVDADKSGDYDKETSESFKQQLRDLTFTADTFNEFSVGDKGVTIIYDAEFPHVIQALEPNGKYFFTWAQVKTFIKPDGLLGNFAR